MKNLRQEVLSAIGDEILAAFIIQIDKQEGYLETYRVSLPHTEEEVEWVLGQMDYQYDPTFDLVTGTIWMEENWIDIIDSRFHKRIRPEIPEELH